MVVVAVAAVSVMALAAVATATILTPPAPPIAAPVPTTTPEGSARASAVPTPSQASPAATTSPVPTSTPPTPTPPPSVAPPPHSVTAGVIQAVTPDVRVRASADLDADVVATLSAGQQARTTASTVQADGYTWTDIELNPSGIRGWAAIADGSGTDPWLMSVGDGPLVVTTGDSSALLSPAIGVGGYAELVDVASGSRELLTSGSLVTDLAVAPDGGGAAVVVNGRWIEMIGLDTVTDLESNPSARTRTFGIVRDPSFRPDGLAVAYRAGDDWGLLEPQLEWYGTGASPTLASVGPAAPPVWSPDGNEVWTDVMGADGVNHDVAALGLDGSVRQVTDSRFFDGSPAPAPDGRSIVYFSDDERGALSIATAGPDGSGRRILHTPKFLGGGSFAPLRWEPAGTRIAFRFDYTEDPENEVPSRVEVIDVVTGEHTVFAGPGVDCGELTWSPSGTRLAMVCRAEPGAARHLFVMGVDGSGVVDLGPAIEMDWARVLSR
jgi:hypothetical protein